MGKSLSFLCVADNDFPYISYRGLAGGANSNDSKKNDVLLNPCNHFF